MRPLFPFGHGLSYTSFRHSDLSVRAEKGNITAVFTSTNTGKRTGADVPQVYVALPGKDGFVTRLGGFHRVELAPGASERIEVKVDPRLLARYDAEAAMWRIAAGRYEIRLANDAADTGIGATVDLSATSFAP